MKKLSKIEVINLLKKRTYTYKQLSKITGYHPKSLIRINKLIKLNNITNKKENTKKEIIKEYLNNKYKNYKDFYNNTKYKNQISYSYLTKILKNVSTNKEVLIIKKTKNNHYFQIIDYKTKNILFKTKSKKNNTKTFKEILYKILKDYGKPENITFHNFSLKDTNTLELLKKYKINYIEMNSIYKNITPIQKTNIKVKYTKTKIDMEDFYELHKRVTISNNTIQFKNIRYKIETYKKIKKNTRINLYYNEKDNKIFISYLNKNYNLKPYKKVTSIKGNTKY